MPGIIRVATVALAAAFLAGSVAAQDRTADLRARFAKEPSAVNKAKLMPQLGDAEFVEIDMDVTQGHLREALAVLEEYRQEVETCNKGLDATGLDAEKHPGGFKQLQFSLRDSLRRLDALVVSMTGDDQAPFLLVRKDLNDVNQHLIQQLFPRETPGSKEPAKPAH